MWYTKPDNTDVVEGNPMKEKTYQTRCGTIHYWVSVSNPDIRRAVALGNLISDGRQRTLRKYRLVFGSQWMTMPSPLRQEV